MVSGGLWAAFLKGVAARKLIKFHGQSHPYQGHMNITNGSDGLLKIKRGHKVVVLWGGGMGLGSRNE